MAARIGIKHNEFWEMTPYEFFIYIEAFREIEEDRSKELIVQAYYTEAFARMKKLPKINELFKDNKKEKKKQDSKNMFEEIKRLNAMLGGEVIGGS